MGPWMLPASHTVRPPPQMVAYFLTVSPHFGTDHSVKPTVLDKWSGAHQMETRASAT